MHAILYFPALCDFVLKIFLLGVLAPPSSCNATLHNVNGNRALVLTWNAPYSLSITNGKKVLHYAICSDQATQLGCLNITDVSDCSKCTKTFNSSDPYFVTHRFTAGSQVVMFAVNGAGNGNEATFQITADGALCIRSCPTCRSLITIHTTLIYNGIVGNTHLMAI